MTTRHTIITCPQWGARPPKQGIVTMGQATRIIFHHTASHLAQISQPITESIEEAKRYARDIQSFHMDTNGWIDSGHTFLVTRGGHILQGRWIAVSAIEARHMVMGAHCPGQNKQIGIEHEHLGNEKMTRAQHEASAWLQAWIAAQYGLNTVLPVAPHCEFYATECPANLADDIPAIWRRAQVLLNQYH